MSYRSISYWFDSLGAEPELRSPLPGDLEVDVAIVGGGFTGLWTAYYLMRTDPSCRVAVIERETAGFGASGRNGGWCVAMIHGLEEFFEQRSTERRCLARGDQSERRRGGCHLSRPRESKQTSTREEASPSQPTRSRQSDFVRILKEYEREIGWTEEDIRWLDPEEVDGPHPHRLPPWWHLQYRTSPP